MKREFIICDVCGCENNPLHQTWETRPSRFELTLPRDGVNGGAWSLDVCHSCRAKIHDAISGVIESISVEGIKRVAAQKS